MVTLNEIIIFTDYATGMRLLDCSKLTVNWKSNFLTWRHHQFFLRFFVSPVKVSYCSKFHVNIIPGFGVLTIFYKGLTRNPEIGNIPVWGFTNNCRRRQVRNTKFGKNASTKVLLNAAKFLGYTCYCFCIINAKPTGGKNYPISPDWSQEQVIVFKNLEQFKEIITQTDWFLDYNCFKDFYKMVAIYLNKEQALDADLNAKEQRPFPPGNNALAYSVNLNDDTNT